MGVSSWQREGNKDGRRRKIKGRRGAGRERVRNIYFSLCSRPRLACPKAAAASAVVYHISPSDATRKSIPENWKRKTRCKDTEATAPWVETMLQRTKVIICVLYVQGDDFQ